MMEGLDCFACVTQTGFLSGNDKAAMILACIMITVTA